MQGFGANFARLGAWNVAMFLTLEQAKKGFRILEEHLANEKKKKAKAQLVAPGPA